MNKITESSIENFTLELLEQLITGKARAEI
jgi:hypothetical protein